jgi:hypothetical protein
MNRPGEPQHVRHDTFLHYERRRRAPQGLFAARFVVLASFGLLIGIGLLVIDVASAGLALLAWRDGVLAPFHYELLVPPTVRAGLDGLLLFGSTAVLWRSHHARHLLITFAKGQLADVAITLLFLLLGVGRVRANALDTLAFRIGLAAVAFRCVWALICYRAYAGLHADFYFKPDPTAAPHPAPKPITVHKRIVRFIVRGRDLKTGKDVEFTSRASTPVLATRSAITLGLDPQSVQIDPLNVDP